MALTKATSKQITHKGPVTGDAVQNIHTVLEGLNTDITAAETSISNVNSSLTSSINTVNTNLSAAITAGDAAVQANLNTVNSNLTSSISSVNTNLTNGLNAVNTNLTNSINSVNTTLTNSINAVSAEVDVLQARFVSVKDFGAVGNGVADDTAAVQNAINHCLNTNLDSLGRPTRHLLIDGRCRITSPLVINRLVDSVAADRYFMIRGESGGGFYTDVSGLTMFTTSLPYSGTPVSQLVKFQDVYFESAEAVKTTTFVLDTNKFLRTIFQGCNFVKTRCLSAPAAGTYTQSLYFFECDMRRVPGVFFESFISYDLKVIGCLMEATANGWKFSAAGCAFVGNCMEGMTSGYTIKATGNGLTVAGNYFEGSAVDLDFTGGDNLGFSITGNYFGGQSGSRTAIEWGNVYRSESSGNYAVEGLHTFTTGVRNLSINDYSLGSFTNASPTHEVFGSLVVEDPTGYSNSRVSQALNKRKFTGQVVGSTNANQNFLRISRTGGYATIIIDIVAIGVHPGVDTISQMNRWVVTENAGGVSIDTVSAYNKAYTPVGIFASGTDIYLTWNHAGSGANFYQVAYEVLGVAGSTSTNSISVTPLV